MKDAHLKDIISSVIGSTRKGREKVIRAVRKKYPEISRSKIRSVYEREGFCLQKKLKKRVKNNPANPVSIPLCANQEWAMGFMSDSLVDGRKFRTLNVVDHFNRRCLGIKINYSLPSRMVIQKLVQLMELYSKPERIRTDNGPEFTSKLFQCWLNQFKAKVIRKSYIYNLSIFSASYPSPSLQDFPHADNKVKEIALELWGPQ